MHNPLHFDHAQTGQQTEMSHLKVPEEPLHGAFSEESDFCNEKEDPVHSWSVDDVVSWVQENVPIQSERLEGITPSHSDAFNCYLTSTTFSLLCVESLRICFILQNLRRDANHLNAVLMVHPNVFAIDLFLKLYYANLCL
jgi:hypothetical protein